MKERKQKTLTYKHVVFDDIKVKLAPALSKALAQLRIGRRREQIGPSHIDPIWRVIGYFKLDNEFIFGVLMRYVPGTNSAGFVDDVNADSFTIEQFAAPFTDEGQRRELVESMLFFGAIDNHMVLMQSSGLRAEHLETHIQWLLHKAETLSIQSSMELTDQMPPSIVKTLNKQKVKSLEIGGTFHSDDEDPYIGKVGSTESISHQGTTTRGILETLKGFLSPDKASMIDFKDFEEPNIEYTLNIKYKRDTSKKGHKLMNTLGSALRNAEGINTTIHLVGGGKIKGDDLKLSGKININTYNGVPNADEVFSEMKVWLLEKITSGDVKPT